MNNFTVIYKILKALERSMDFEEFDRNQISPDMLKVSQERRDKLLIEMQNSGYISGLIIKQFINQKSPCICEPINPTITIKGLEYLEDNSMMKKVEATLKGVIDVIK